MEFESVFEWFAILDITWMNTGPYIADKIEVPTEKTHSFIMLNFKYINSWSQRDTNAVFS